MSSSIHFQHLFILSDEVEQPVTTNTCCFYSKEAKQINLFSICKYNYLSFFCFYKLQLDKIITVLEYTFFVYLKENKK